MTDTAQTVVHESESIKDILAEAASDPLLVEPPKPQLDAAGNVIEPPKVIDHLDQCRDLVSFCGPMIETGFPNLHAVYAGKGEAFAQALAGISQKYSWDLSALDKYPELALAVLILPALPATIKAVQADVRAITAPAAPAGTVDTLPGKVLQQTEIIDKPDADGLHNRI